HLHGRARLLPLKRHQPQHVPALAALELAPLPALQQAAARRGHEPVPGVPIGANGRSHTRTSTSGAVSIITRANATARRARNATARGVSYGAQTAWPLTRHRARPRGMRAGVNYGAQTAWP